MFKQTQAAGLPYKGAPLTAADIIQQQVEFEDRMAPHLEWTQPESVMKKELPSTKWAPAAAYVFGINIRRFAFLLP